MQNPLDARRRRFGHESMHFPARIGHAPCSSRRARDNARRKSAGRLSANDKDSPVTDDRSRYGKNAGTGARVQVAPPLHAVRWRSTRDPHDRMARVLHMHANLMGAPVKSLHSMREYPSSRLPCSKRSRTRNVVIASLAEGTTLTAMRVRSSALRAMGASIMRCHGAMTP